MTYPFVPSIGFFGTTRKITIQYTSNSFTLFNGSSAYSSPNSRLNLYDVASLFVSPTAGKHLVAFEFIFDTNTIFNDSIQIGGEFRDITIQNYGVIAGRGGDGRSVPQSLVTSGFKESFGGAGNLGGAGNHDGNPAIYINYDCDEFTIKNESSGFIAGGGDGNYGIGDWATDSASAGPKDYAYAQGNCDSGGGGGWNGGRGGWAREQFVYVIAARDPGGGGSVQTREDYGAQITRQGGYSSVVSSRSSSGSTGGSGGTSTNSAYEQWPGSPTLPSLSTSGSGGSGGSGLNGGGHGLGGNGAAAAATANGNGGAGLALGRVCSGGGGGNGIGSGGSTYVAGAVSTNGAGGGYSVQVQSATLGSSSFTNSGRVYGVSNISVT